MRLARGTEREILSVGALLALAASVARRRPRVATVLPAAALAALWGLLLHFFRDPERTPPEGDGLIIAPADGRVVEIERVHEPLFVRGPALKIAIFMSLWDVHVNRAPLEGEVVLVEHVPGRFVQAFRPEAAIVNEHNLIGLRTPRGRVLVKQISGIMARRIACWVSPGDGVNAGQRLGIIKLGSRVEVYLPPDIVPAVHVNERVWAGSSVLGHSP